MNFGKMCSSDLCRIAFFCVVAYLIWHFLLRSVVREGVASVYEKRLNGLDVDEDMGWRNIMDVKKRYSYHIVRGALDGADDDDDGGW